MSTFFIRGVVLVVICFLFQPCALAVVNAPISSSTPLLVAKDETQNKAISELHRKDGPEISTEVRWFFQGRVPAEVLGWFSRQSRLGVSISEGENRKKACEGRPDLYLVASDAPHLGVKLREGKLEIKFLAESKALDSSNGRPIGQAEQWQKWGWKYATDIKKDKAEKEFDDRVAAAFLGKTPAELRIEVLKTRCQRKFGFSPSGVLTPVPLGGKVVAGLAAEVTVLKVADKDWWTLAIEVVGDVNEPFVALQNGVLWMLEDYPGPALDVTHSYSYPHWVTHEISAKVELFN